MEITPLCEVKLVKKLTELLNSVESMETTMKDAMRKAKAKIQREWSNFKEGYVQQYTLYILKHKIIFENLIHRHTSKES